MFFLFSKIDTAISRPPKSIAVTRRSFSHTILKLRNKCMCFLLRTVAFRGHGLSLLALAKGMSMLFAKDDFSRPSLKQFCGVFGHVLFPQMFSVGRVIAMVFDGSSSAQSQTQDKEGYGSIASHEENGFVFSRSQRPSAPNNRHIKYSNDKN